MAVLELVEPTGHAIQRASDLAGAAAALGRVDRLVPVDPELHPLLPEGGLRRGSTVAVAPGASSLVLALLAGASAAGAWSAVVGMPGLGILAASQAGVALERLALVPEPGPEWATVVAALLDGVDLVVAVPPGPVPARVASRLAARARQRGSVLLPVGRWEGAALTLTAGPGVWEGLGAGHGRLRCRELTITAQGRGAAGRPRRLRVRLPDPTGRLAAVLPPAPALAAPVPGRGRPALAVIDGESVTEEVRAA
ncbi:MAG: hypothetical protein GEV12_02895 [Micromonosporaceae bacterium]|nr:hypothetical protein [Micromonosporaceae bacterium]